MHECFYLSMVEKALQLMSSRLLAFYNSGKSSLSYLKEELFDERSFAKKIRKIFKVVAVMD